MSRAVLLLMSLAVGACGDDFEALLKEIEKYPTCDSLDTDPECRRGGDDMSGTWGWYSTGGSSSTGEGSGSISGTESAGSTTGSGTSTTGDITGSGSTTGEAPAVCGNGVVEAGEECDGGERCFECTRDRWIFATAALHSGNIGGIEGGNSRCQQFALQSGAADDTWTTFVAWLSDSEHDVRDSLPASIRGRYVRTDGVVVIDVVDDLFSGELLAPINVDEFGQPAPGGVMTGTLPDGTAAPGTHCENWTSAEFLDESRYKGFADATDAWWTMGQNPETNPVTCAGVNYRLYCLEGA